MSGKGNCYDNAVAESFFHTLKVETIHGERLRHAGGHAPGRVRVY
jgi:transposase InsO family protein